MCRRVVLMVIAAVLGAIGCARPTSRPAARTKEVAAAPKATAECDSASRCMSACMDGDGQSCTRLGKLHDDEGSVLQGNPVPHDNVLAFELYTRACTLGDPEGCEQAGWAYKLGDGVEVSDRAAELMVRQAYDGYAAGCDRDHARSCVGLAEMVRTGVLAPPADLERAVALYKKGCRLGNDDGCVGLAKHGSAVEAAASACGATTLDACNEMGLRYEHGRGVDQDPARALELYQLACDGGNARGCDLQGFLVEHGLGRTQDHAAARALYEKSCGARHTFPLGCYDLGRMYQHGLGGDQDDAKAIDLFELSCGSPEEIGCHSLAYMFEHGLGASKSAQKALELYEKSCTRGEPAGCHGFAAMLEANQYGIPPEYEKAAALYHRACTDGYGPSCFRLAELHSEGEIADRDGGKVLEYLQRACSLGHDRGCHEVEKRQQVLGGGPPLK